MRVQQYATEENWLDGRRGSITGTRAKDIDGRSGAKRKKGYYELIAEKIALPPTNESPMYRGKRLEDIAIERFREETGKAVENDLVIWSRDDAPDIAVSPDGWIGHTEAVEVKCLSSASHLEAWMTRAIPDEYQYQVLQYFVVNDDLQKLFFLFFDPRMPKDLFWIEVSRADVQTRVSDLLEIERRVLLEIKEMEDRLIF